MREDVSICLDEIDAARRIIKDSSNSKKAIAIAKRWVKTHKEKLKQLNYNGIIGK